jgi:hypothetical protein
MYPPPPLPPYRYSPTVARAIGPPRNRDPPRRSRAGAGEGRHWSKAIVVCRVSEITSQVKSRKGGAAARVQGRWRQCTEAVAQRRSHNTCVSTCGSTEVGRRWLQCPRRASPPVSYHFQPVTILTQPLSVQWMVPSPSARESLCIGATRAGCLGASSSSLPALTRTAQWSATMCGMMTMG